MKHLILLAVLVSSSFSAFANDKGNGGDVVMCGTPKTMRVLDSVVMEDEGYFQLAPKADRYQVTVEKILAKLDNDQPHLAKSLRAFYGTFQNRLNKETNVYWVDRKPRDLQDENLSVDIPENCGPTIIQAVVRMTTPIKRYYYDPAVVARLEKQGSELAWLLIHEWLRDYIEDANIIRFVNGYLNSQEFLQDESDKVRDTLKTLGFKRTGVTSVEFAVNSKIYTDVSTALASLNQRVEQIVNENVASLRGSARKAYVRKLKAASEETYDFLELHNADDSRMYRIVDSLEDREAQNEWHELMKKHIELRVKISDVLRSI